MSCSIFITQTSSLMYDGKQVSLEYVPRKFVSLKWASFSLIFFFFYCYVKIENRVEIVFLTGYGTIKSICINQSWWLII